MKTKQQKIKSYLKRLFLLSPIIAIPIVTAACGYQSQNEQKINHKPFQTTKVTLDDIHLQNRFFTYSKEQDLTELSKETQNFLKSLQKFIHQVFLRSFSLYYIYNFALLNEVGIAYQIAPINIAIRQNDDASYDVRFKIQVRINDVDDKQFKKVNDLLRSKNLSFTDKQSMLDHFNNKLQMDFAYTKTFIYTNYQRLHHRSDYSLGYVFTDGTFDRIARKSAYDANQLAMRDIKSVQLVSLDQNTKVFRPPNDIVKFYEKGIITTGFKDYDLKDILFTNLKDQLRIIQNVYFKEDKQKPNQNISNLGFSSELFQFPYFMSDPNIYKPEDVLLYPDYLPKQLQNKWSIFNQIEQIDYESIFDNHHLALINPFFYQDLSLELVQLDKNVHCHSDGVCHGTTK
ncbi:hypothetical protein OF377_01330 [Ureaplasma sp. ES3154-GEN]|uniref:hypothetical protein n=1 Tax=Ureaplasma sp. ES3154-GEN TaxID=2984844 RepID=UPI0021E88199|nr:hypothetical protein [Ureaplasma sp. ES3154-GEN]MCV3743529.1 hypothetical protein [Ureaplasma sp. ES3154-GEN]